MKPLWIKFPRHLLTTAQALSAGTDAVLVYIDAACMCFDAESEDGVIQASMAKVIGKGLLAHDGWTESRLQAAVASAIAASLLTKAKDDGSLTVRDWQHIRPAKDDAERQQNCRDKKRDAASRESHGMSRDHRDFVVPEQSRVEESSTLPPSLPQKQPSTHKQGYSSTTQGTSSTTPHAGTTPAPAPGEEGGREGGRLYDDPEEGIAQRLTALGVLRMDPDAQHALAASMVRDGCSSFDLDDLAKLAGKQGENPAGLLTHWLRSGDWRQKLGQSRGASTPIYGEPAQLVPGRGDAGPARLVDPSAVGISYCEECKSMEFGKHLVGHGPIGWKLPGPTPKATVDPSLPKRAKLSLADDDALRAVKLKQLKAYAAEQQLKEAT